MDLTACGHWLGLLAAQEAYLFKLCRSYADYRSFSLPPILSLALCFPSVLPDASSPCLFSSFFHSFFLFLLLNAPSGGFGYTGLQSSSQNQYSYSLSQGSRARTQSSEVNEALYRLDRVIHGKSPTCMHEGRGFSSANLFCQWWFLIPVVMQGGISRGKASCHIMLLLCICGQWRVGICCLLLKKGTISYCLSAQCFMLLHYFKISCIFIV